MLGRTADGLCWMARYIERAENTARLIETGQRMALIRHGGAASEWAAVVAASGCEAGFEMRHGPEAGGAHVVDYLLRDPSNPSSALRSLEAARTNARAVRTAITREVWEAVNECWLDMSAALARPVSEAALPDLLERLRRHGALVRGALDGTMLRNATFDFLQIGTALERADSTARILDVKYHVLLPRSEDVGGTLDTIQWEQLLTAVHVRRAYLSEYGPTYRADNVAEFLILNARMPRSLRYSAARVAEHLDHLAGEYGERPPVADRARAIVAELDGYSIGDVFDLGLHDFLTGVIGRGAGLAGEIARTYRFAA